MSIKGEFITYNNNFNEINYDVYDLCMGDIINVINNIDDNEVIDKNKGWYIKKVLIKKMVEGKTFKEVGKEMNVNYNSIYRYYQKWLPTIKERLENEIKKDNLKYKKTDEL